MLVITRRARPHASWRCAFPSAPIQTSSRAQAGVAGASGPFQNFLWRGRRGRTMPPSSRALFARVNAQLFLTTEPQGSERTDSPWLAREDSRSFPQLQWPHRFCSSPPQLSRATRQRPLRAAAKTKQSTHPTKSSSMMFSAADIAPWPHRHRHRKQRSRFMSATTGPDCLEPRSNCSTPRARTAQSQQAPRRGLLCRARRSTSQTAAGYG